MTHVGQSWDEPLRVLEVNVLGTAALLAAARECGTDPRVLVTSSAEVYGAVTDPSQLPLTEESPTAPLTPYAASKLAAEALCAQAWLGHGQQVVTVRPFNHIGPGQSPNFAVSALAKRIVDAERSGRHRDPGGQPVGPTGLHRRAGRGPVLPAAHRVRGRPATVYNVCSGRDVAIQEIADRLLAAGRQLGATRARPVADAAGRGARAAGRPRPAAGGHRLEAGDPPRPDAGRRARPLAAPSRTDRPHRPGRPGAAREPSRPTRRTARRGWQAVLGGTEGAAGPG